MPQGVKTLIAVVDAAAAKPVSSDAMPSTVSRTPREAMFCDQFVSAAAAGRVTAPGPSNTAHVCRWGLQQFLEHPRVRTVVGANTQNGKDETALFVAARSGRLAAVHCLLQHGAEPWRPSFSGGSDGQAPAVRLPLHAAIAAGHTQVALTIIAAEAAQAESNPRDDTHDCLQLYDDSVAGAHATPLYLATLRGNQRVLASLIAGGAQDRPIFYQEGLSRANDELCIDGDTALHAAARKGDYRAAMLLSAVHQMACLTEEGFTPQPRNSAGQTALHAAVTAGNPHITKLLLQHGFARTARDAFGKTPLDLATQFAREAQADPNLDLFDVKAFYATRDLLMPWHQRLFLSHPSP